MAFATGARCEKLAFLLKPGSPPSVVNRMRGIASAVVESGKGWSQNDNVLVCEPDDIKAVSRFLRTRCPDVIVCGNDMRLPSGCMRRFPRLNVQMPYGLPVSTISRSRRKLA